MKLKQIYEEIKNSSIKYIECYRGIGLTEKSLDSLNVENIGISWTLDSVFAQNRSEYFIEHGDAEFGVVLKINVSVNDIDWDYTIGQFAGGDYWKREFEVVLNTNTNLDATIWWDTENKFEGTKVSINTGGSRYDETMIAYNDEMGDFTKLKNDFFDIYREF